MKVLNLYDLLKNCFSKRKIILILAVLIMIFFCVFQYENSYNLNEHSSNSSMDELKSLYAEREEYNHLLKSRVLDMDDDNYYLGRTTIAVKECKADLRTQIEMWMYSSDTNNSIVEYASTDLHELEYKCLTGRWSEKTEDGVNFYFDFKSDNMDDIEKFNYAIHLIAQEKFSELGADGVVSVIDDTVLHLTNGENYLSSAKKSFKKALESYGEDVEDMELSLSPDKANYYKKFYLKEDISITKSDIVKMIIEGLLIGIVVSIILVTLKYLFNGRIKISDEINMVYHLKLLDSEDANDGLTLIKDTTTDCQDAVLYTEADDGMMQNVAIVVQLKKTKYKSFEQELEFCRNNNIPVSGVILV